jgi:hypothetical protein
MMAQCNLQQVTVSSFCLLFEPENIRVMLQKHNVAFSMSLADSITASAVVATTLLDAFLCCEKEGEQEQLIRYVSCTSVAMLACSCAIYL